MCYEQDAEDDQATAACEQESERERELGQVGKGLARQQGCGERDGCRGAPMVIKPRTMVVWGQSSIRADPMAP